ncbi:MAG: hypothetical protein LBS74_04830 [Oscillospiraceae bacterium]|nr:hypothetical protein [Oscillospiraceae bacterium]
MLKKLLAIVLVLVMLIGVVPVFEAGAVGHTSSHGSLTYTSAGSLGHYVGCTYSSCDINRGRPLDVHSFSGGKCTNCGYSQVTATTTKAKTTTKTTTSTTTATKPTATATKTTTKATTTAKTTAKVTATTKTTQKVTAHVHDLYYVQNGNTGHKVKCKTCSIDALDVHTYVNGVCSLCGWKYVAVPTTTTKATINCPHLRPSGANRRLVKAATKTSHGSEGMYCLDCNATLATYVIHYWENGKCTVCGALQNTTLPKITTTTTSVKTANPKKDSKAKDTQEFLLSLAEDLGYTVIGAIIVTYPANSSESEITYTATVPYDVNNYKWGIIGSPYKGERGWLDDDWSTIKGTSQTMVNRTHTFSVTGTVTASATAEAGIIFAKASATLSISVGITDSNSTGISKFYSVDQNELNKGNQWVRIATRCDYQDKGVTADVLYLSASITYKKNAQGAWVEKSRSGIKTSKKTATISKLSIPIKDSIVVGNYYAKERYSGDTENADDYLNS